jgi:hypothetical protein
MISRNDKTSAETIRGELESARNSFHGLLASLSEEDLRRQSLNPGWTNGEIVAHMLFGFIVVNALLPMTRTWGRLPKGSSKSFAALLNANTKPFNRINAWGARIQGQVFTYRRLGKIYDWVHAALLKQVGTVKEEEWQRGMYYPTQWDSNFNEFMTLEKLFHYPVIHFNFHRTQISH